MNGEGPSWELGRGWEGSLLRFQPNTLCPWVMGFLRPQGPLNLQWTLKPGIAKETPLLVPDDEV